jgi:nesprin-1
MALSINVIGSHLAEHSSDEEKADRLVARLAKVNNDWDSVCEKATDWQTRLQKALLENSEFHATIDELLGWLEKTRTIVEEAEPIDLTQDKEVLLDKYNKFLDLKKDLHRCEPRVVSLQEAADQLEMQADATTCREVKIKLNRLSQSLKGLIQVCGIYCCNLARALDLPVLPGESLEASTLYETARVLPALTQQLLEGRSTRIPRSSDDASEDDLNRGVLSRSYRFLGRVVRAALPIQALMLLLLGVSSIVPLERDELICTLQNNLQRSLEPMLRWSNGPPPI